MYDVIVVGAGPAGSCAAHQCAKRGLSTLLLEKERLPRRKCCAGGVLERALRHLDFQVPDRVVERETHGARIWVGERSNVIRSDRRTAIVVRRERFDKFLAETAAGAGATVLEEERALSALERGATVQVNTEEGAHEAKCLILANGVNSKLAEGLMGPYARRRFASGMSFNCGLEGQPEDLMEFHFYPEKERGAYNPPRYGYGWMFPCDHGANIGAGGAGFDRSLILAKVREIEARCRERYGGMAWREELAGHPIPLFVRERMHTLRTMAVGDAAGLANPITGEGMTYAFASAKLAARAAEELVRGNEARATERYERSCRQAIVRDLDAAQATQRAIRWLLGTLDLEEFMDAFCASEGLKSACLGIVQGKNDWTLLLRKALPRAPGLYLRSLRR